MPPVAIRPNVVQPNIAQANPQPIVPQPNVPQPNVPQPNVVPNFAIQRPNRPNIQPLPVPNFNNGNGNDLHQVNVQQQLRRSPRSNKGLPPIRYSDQF